MSIFHLLPVWWHPNEPRYSNHSEFELNKEKTNMTEIFFAYNKLNNRRFAIIYVH